MASTTPSLGHPSAKEKKYDRQLRLWGANGQNRLEAAHLALFGATATGCEVLKNLILPSVGEFTVIDDKVVEEADLGTNFFLDEESIGESRAERTAAILGELNPDAKGSFIQDSLTNLLKTKPDLFDPKTSPFTHLIIVSPFRTSDILLFPPEIPTFLVHSLGFLTSIRLSLPSHPIIETHPDSLIDLRLLSPWPELTTFSTELISGIDTPEASGGMSDHAHGHVPYVVLLLHYLNIWKSTHDGKPPGTYAEKNEFKELVRGHMRKHVAGGSEENYEEAMGAVLKNLRPAEISSEANSVYNDIRCLNPGNDSEDFWIIAHAVKLFVDSPEQGAGMLPLSGAVPDMKAESKTYVSLQQCYRERAKRDAGLVYETVKHVLRDLQRKEDEIDYDTVALFCKHANFVRCVNFRGVMGEYELDEHHKKAVKKALEDWDAAESLIHDYIALRAWQEFYDKNGRVAGAEDGEYEEDVKAVEEIAGGYLKRIGVEELGKRAKGMCREVVRPGGGELHNIASFAGGVAAQELIKVITQQYVPANNTVIFDGIGSRTAVFEL